MENSLLDKSDELVELVHLIEAKHLLKLYNKNFSDNKCIQIRDDGEFVFVQSNGSPIHSLPEIIAYFKDLLKQKEERIRSQITHYQMFIKESKERLDELVALQETKSD